MRGIFVNTTASWINGDAAYRQWTSKSAQVVEAPDPRPERGMNWSQDKPMFNIISAPLIPALTQPNPRRDHDCNEEKLFFSCENKKLRIRKQRRLPPFDNKGRVHARMSKKRPYLAMKKNHTSSKRNVKHFVCAVVTGVIKKQPYFTLIFHQKKKNKNKKSVAR